MSDYVVSARKYRPDSFETLVGQDNIAKTLKNSILRGQLAHAYLFCGPRGVGKTSAARIFAKTINCSNPSGDMEPCGECESCRSFAEGRSYCIHELDAASNNGVDDIKTLMDQVQIPPQVGKYSVYIIDEVHMLSQSAFNAFLKTLEEPPAHAVFILATTEKHKIIPTILSRCQTYDFNRITIPGIVGNLRAIAAKENISIDDESLHVIASKADGAMRDALTIFDQTVAFCGTDIHYEDVIRNLNVLDYEYGFSLTENFLAGDYASALLTFDEILAKGFNALYFLSSLGSHFRDLLVSKTAGLEALLELPSALKERYREQSSRCSVQFIYKALEIVSSCEAQYKGSINQRLQIEFALMKLSFASKSPEAMTGKSPAAGTPAVPGPAPAATKPILAATGLATAKSVPAAPSEPAPAVESKSVEAPATAAARPASGKKAATGAALSLGALMEDFSEEKKRESIAGDESQTQDSASASLPEDQLILEKWKEASVVTSQPRLSSALSNAKLNITLADGRKVLSFSVINIAQKKWIEEKILNGLEARMQQLVSSPLLRLEVEVIPEEVVEKKLYLPGEKAADLISKNEEVRKLVRDLNLDVK